MKKNKRWFSLIEIVLSIAIAWVILSLWYNSWYKFLQNINKRATTEDVKTKINEVISANYVWRWLKDKRIKRHALVFRNNTNIIDNYYYTEVYKIDPITMIKSPLPTIEFAALERIEFPKEIVFKFNTDIEGYHLPVVPSENTERLVIQRTMPSNELMVFDGSDSNFQVIDPDDIHLLGETDLFIRWKKKLYGWDPIDETHYYWIVPWVIPKNFINPQIDVYYRKEKIWRIIVDTNKRKLIYTAYTDEIDWIEE